MHIDMFIVFIYSMLIFQEHRNMRLNLVIKQ